ncbi:MAG: aminotransferase class IV [Aureliella sp.]
MVHPVAFHNGEWKPLDETALTLDDWGHLQGATLVERMRTVAGRPLDVEGHLQRLRASAEVLRITWPEHLTASLIEQCADRNRAAHRKSKTGALRDFGVVVLLTPGRASSGPPGSRPTLILHTTDLHWSGLAHWYQHGQALITASNRNVPGNCWSTHLKTRSRLHYFLADQQAAASGIAHAGAAMCSIDGTLTESSVANILIVDDQGLVSPPIDSVLHGLSLRRTLRLAGQLGIAARFQPISIESARSARAILLTGSSGCLWPASQLDDQRFPSPTADPTFTALRDAWITDIGLDYVQQAVEEAA